MSCVFWFWVKHWLSQGMSTLCTFPYKALDNQSFLACRHACTASTQLQHNICTIWGSRSIRFVLRSFMLWGQDLSVGGTENSCPHNCCCAVTNLMRADGSADKRQGCLHAFICWLSTAYIVKVQSVASLCMRANMLMWQYVNGLRRSAAC